jgi:hypothetical protein
LRLVAVHRRVIVVCREGLRPVEFSAHDALPLQGFSVERLLDKLV